MGRGVIIKAYGKNSAESNTQVFDVDNLVLGCIISDMYRGVLTIASRPKQPVVFLQCREAP